jgi:hypothetical protein
MNSVQIVRAFKWFKPFRCRNASET